LTILVGMILVFPATAIQQQPQTRDFKTTAMVKSGSYADK